MKNLITSFYLLASFFGMGQAIKFGALGNGINNNGYYAPIRSVFYDTIDKKLYVGGQFVQADNKTVWGAAVWSNNSWDSLRGGLTQYPQLQPAINSSSDSWSWKIIRYKNKIYYVGAIDWVNGHSATGMGVWNGNDWDYPIISPNGYVYDLKVFNDTLYACGLFTKFGNTTCNNVAKFDGVSWKPVGNLKNLYKTYTPARITSLGFYNNQLYVGGGFSDSTGMPQNVARFNGTEWVSVGTGIKEGGLAAVLAMEVYNNELYIGGYFNKSNDIPSRCLVKWNGSNYLQATSFNLDQSGEIWDLKKTKNNRLIVFGGFAQYGQFPAFRLLYIEPNGKDCLITGLDTTFNNPTFTSFSAIELIHDSLVIAGQFKKLDTVNANSIGVITNYNYNANCFYVGIKKNVISNFDRIKMYPNPFTNTIIVELPEEFNYSNSSLEVFDNLGKQIFISQLIEKNKEINLEFLPAGLYHLKVKNDDSFRVFKIMKQ